MAFNGVHDHDSNAGASVYRWSQCHCGQRSLPIDVAHHIDGVGGSLNDGITSH
jgi:hypothetical protein